MQIPAHIAAVIMDMAGSCYSEGLLPEESDELLDWIVAHYPKLKKEYSWVRWPEAEE